MKKYLWLLLTVLAVALCVTAQAEITMNEFPSPDAVPDVYTLFPSEMPPLPQAEFTQEGTVRISGLSAWDVSPDMLTDWEFQFNSWISGSPGLYEDELLVTYVTGQNSAIPAQGQGYSIPLKLNGEKHCEMVLNVSADYENPRKANLSIAFRNEEGTEAQLLEDGSLLIEEEIDTDTDKHKTVMYYLPDGTLDVIESSVFVPGQFWYEKLGSYELHRETDCISGERFGELTVTGELDPEAAPFRITGKTLPVRIRRTDKDPYAWGEKPALPVLDALPADGLPEQWPDEYPDTCPAFTCEVVNGKYVWTVCDLLSYGARVNIQGETYADPEFINYFYRSYTLDEVPDDRIRIVISGNDGNFAKLVETEQGAYDMHLIGETLTDEAGNMKASLEVYLNIYEGREFSLKYVSDGSTAVKQIITSADGKTVIGEYGEDNRLIP